MQEPSTLRTQVEPESASGKGSADRGYEETRGWTYGGIAGRV